MTVLLIVLLPWTSGGSLRFYIFSIVIKNIFFFATIIEFPLLFRGIEMVETFVSDISLVFDLLLGQSLVMISQNEFRVLLSENKYLLFCGVVQIL